MTSTPATPQTIGKKRLLSTPDSPTSSTATPDNAGHDEDGEETLVEEDPLPHEIASDPALRCRYPSKYCLRARTVKKTGALHSMCAFHRAKANRNQRRLEKRKRLRMTNGEVSQSIVVDSKTLLDCPTSMLSVDSSRFQSPRAVAMDFEPFRTPSPLFLEDLQELCELVDVNVKQVSADPSDEELLNCAMQFLL
ncbi:hypothetical protein BBJ29_009731 [Phytophthora kernoviae]|uniref:Uncharacterized protein n=1 Tax=Phytophthora kernoviae TaxID=325452 RepID=A0A3F2RBN2_9STRA|nr:hypothetical protein BBP00_00009829 [Phytophthora kernoviae]RLN55057.1 hypothetical protein BBJ29_009731 [Phytophthora kernoviae]